MKLIVEDLEAGFGRFKVLDGVSLHLEPGSISCIIGPNASGKSTLLRALTGFVRPWGGHVFVDGEEITGWRPQAVLRRGIGYVPQRGGVFPKLTVHENLEMGAYLLPAGEASERLRETYELFPILRERRQQLGHSLSGGQRRALEIARALLMRPRFLLLDEPSLGLAPLLFDQVLEEVRRINERGITILMVEQNVQKALRLAHRVFVLRLGRIVLDSPAAEALKGNRLQAALLGA